MGAWGYTITENDTSSDFLYEVANIIQDYNGIQSVKSGEFIESIRIKILEKRDEIFSLFKDANLDNSPWNADVILTYGLLLLNLKIEPSFEEISLLDKALEHEYSIINDWNEPEERTKVLDEFKSKMLISIITNNIDE